ncbi:MAG: hypothetical protein IT334_04830, partial [Thermomicrobiales bacterium]|nr:hypothetical protein [Thermomicrobiales bacterium]
MRTSSVALGFRRLLLLIGLFALLLGVAPLAPPAPSVSAQDSGWYEDIGDPPARSDAYIPNEESDGFSLAAVPATVDINSRNAVRTFFNNHFRHSMPLVGWTGNFNGCAAGTQSAAFRQAVLDQLTWYRAMAGVPANVSLSSTFNSYAQAAALIMGANEYITHFPPSNAKCYTGTGYTAAGHSNLHIFAAGRFPDEPASEADPFPNGHDPVTGYMEDTGGNNLAVGHRRWLLYPQTTTFGTGDVAGVHPDSFVYTNAIWVQDNIDGARPATRTPYVAWPPAGYVPYQVVFSRWSFSYPGADFSSASVNVSRNGTTITAPIDDRATYGVGENSIVFRPEALGDGAAWPPPLNGDNTYRVTINNVRIGGAARSFTYDVIVFNPATEDSGGTATVTLGANSGNIDETISFSLKSFPKGQKVNVEWRDLGTGKTLLKTVTANSSSGNYNGSFVVPPGPGDLHMVTFTSGSVIKQAFFFVNIEVGFESEYVAGGVEVRWTIRGLGANESFQAIWLKILDQGGFLMQLPTPLTFEDLTADANGTSSYTFLFPSWVETGPQIIGVLTADGDFGGDVLTVLANPPEAIPLVEGSGTNAFLSADTYFTDVELDGRDSTPSAGASITSYEWSVNGAVIATGANPTVGLPVGEHEVILTIVDSHGLRTSGSVYAFIDVEYGSVLAYAGENRTISTLSAPATVQLDGSASIVDEFHTIAGYAWYIQGQATPFSTLAQPTVSLGLGTTTIELRVTNNTGDVGTTSVAITVALGPVANAGADRTVDTYGTSASVTLNGSGSSAQPGRSISSYSWSRNGSPIATGVSPTVTLPVGTHTVSLTVTDNTGATGTDDVVVTVTQIPPAAATIGAADGTVGAEISYNLTNFPKNAVVTLSFVSNDNKTDALGTVTTDGNGAASGTITVPARPGGSGSKIVFT